MSQQVQVETVPRQVLHDFWKRWYFPGNATLYMVGDFDSGAGGGLDAAEQLVRETFGRIAPGRLPGNGVPGELKQRQLVSSCPALPCSRSFTIIGDSFDVLYHMHDSSMA